MNKKMLALALSSSLSTAWAYADTPEIYGKLAVGIEGVSATGASNGGTNYAGRSRLASETSYIGFKGGEDLGNGLKAIWQVEQAIAMDGSSNGPNNPQATSSTNGFANRNSFVGMEGNFGRVVVGRYDNSYNTYSGDIGLDFMGDTSAQILGAGAIFARNQIGSQNNSITYFSPKFGNIDFGASYGFDENKNQSENAYNASLGAKYESNGLVAVMTYSYSGPAEQAVPVSTTSLAGTKRTQAYLTGLGYHFADTYIGAGYEWTSADYLATLGQGDYTLKQQGWNVGASQKFGALTLMTSYSQLLKLDGAGHLNSGYSDGDYKANEVMVGATYDLSKRTQLMAFYAQINNSAGAQVDFGSNGLNSSVQTTNGVPNFGAGASPRLLGFGMKHVF